MSNSLPASVALVQPSQAQFERQYALNGVEWRGALSHEAYMRRESFLASQGIAANSGLTYWALVDTAQDPSSDRVLAGCETLRKPALISRNGQVTKVTAYGIASVFTPPEARGKGAASRMIQEVTKLLKTWQNDGKDEPCTFAVLFSDIGKSFYARHGWRPHPSDHIQLPPSDAVDESLPEPRLLNQSHLPALCDLDEHTLKMKLQRHEPGVAVALVPDYDTITWHLSRDTFVAKELHGRAPEIHGASVSLDRGGSVWAIWSRVFSNPDPTQSKGNTLYILRFVILSDVENEESPADSTDDEDPLLDKAIAAVLSAAQREAAKWAMEKVQIWNPDARIVRAVRNCKGHEHATIHRRDTESITSLKWYGEASEEDTLVWLENEKYGWC